jgi:hypothetical protein
MKRHVRGGVKRVVPEPASDDEGRELVARGKRLLRAAKEDVEGASRVLEGDSQSPWTGYEEWRRYGGYRWMQRL